MLTKGSRHSYYNKFMFLTCWIKFDVDVHNVKIDNAIAF